MNVARGKLFMPQTISLAQTMTAALNDVSLFDAS